MANDEYKINAKITADSSNFSKGIKDATNKTKKFSKQLTEVINKLGKNEFTKNMANLSLALGGVGKAFSSVTKSAKIVSDAIKDTSEAYRIQLKAETQLEQAARNNPLMNSSSTNELKNFASEMQKISTYGDEQLIPMMAQLTASGRSEIEVEKIIQTALDLSASGMMDMEGAVKALNSTLNGNIGTLGRQISGIKNLTEEELKSGKAIDIIGKQFEGMSKKVTESTGSVQQLKNAWGDLKEEIGAGFEKNLTPMRKYFTEMLSNWAQAKKEKREYFEIEEQNKTDDKTSFSLEKEITQRQKNVDSIQEEINGLMELLNNQDLLNEKIRESRGYISESTYKAQLSSAQKRYENEFQIITQLKNELSVQKELEETERNRKKAQDEENAILAAQLEKDEKASKIKLENEKSLNRELIALQENAKLKNEQVSIQDKINLYIKYTSDLIANSEGLITEENQLYKDRLVIIQQLESELKKTNSQSLTAKELAEKNRKQYEEDLKFYRDIEDKKVEAMIERLKKEEQLEKEKQQRINDFKNSNINELSSLLEITKGLSENISKSFKEGLAEGLVSIQKIFESYKQIVKQMTSVTIAEFSVLLKKYKGDTLSQITLISSFVISRIKKTGDKIKNILKSIVNIFGKTLNGIKSLIKMNISDMLDELLIFEDGILTFFLITLPQLPSYLESVIGSIITLINTIKNSISVEMLTNIFKSMLNSLTTYFPQLLSDMVELILMLGQSIINAVSSWVSEGGFKVLIDAVFDAVISIMTFIRDNLPTIVSTAAQLITDIIVSLCEHLPEIIQLVIDTLIELIPTLIVSVISAVGQIIPALLAMIPDIIEALINAIPDIVVAIIEALPDLIAAIVIAVAEIIPELVTIVPKIIVALCKAFSEAPKKIVETIFNKDAWINAFDKIGDSFTAGWDKVKGGFSKVKDWFKGIFGFATGTNNAPSGLSLVGEQGPELIDLHGGERIYNAKDTRAILTGSGGNNSSNNFNVTFNNTQDTTAYAMIRQLQQYNREMAINGIL